jgi:DNA-binding IclR family transcriptional regulator
VNHLRTLAILRYLQRCGRILPIAAEVALGLDCSRASAAASLSVLARRGLVRRGPPTLNYWGRLVLTWGLTRAGRRMAGGGR